MRAKKTKILVIVGPTASGKSDLAVQLAKKFGGEVISADSRQVYRGLDIGSGKITKREMKNVPHYLLDVASPKKVFTVAQYQKLAKQKLEEIISRQKLPIICGGTGFYIQALVDNLVLPNVPPNPKLRAKLQHNITTQKLYEILCNIDPIRARNIDRNNKIRLIRAIEIATALGKVPKLQHTSQEGECVVIWLGLRPETAKLKQNIHNRLQKRMRMDLVAEVKKLHENGLSWKRLEALGLEYRYVALYLQNKLTRAEMLQKLETEIWRYAKRQMTWFKRDERIRWFAAPRRAAADATKLLGKR